MTFDFRQTININLSFNKIVFNKSSEQLSTIENSNRNNKKNSVIDSFSKNKKLSLIKNDEKVNEKNTKITNTLELEENTQNLNSDFDFQSSLEIQTKNDDKRKNETKKNNDSILINDESMIIYNTEKKSNRNHLQIDNHHQNYSINSRISNQIVDQTGNLTISSHESVIYNKSPKFNLPSNSFKRQDKVFDYKSYFTVKSSFNNKNENNSRKPAIINKEFNTTKDNDGMLTNKENKNISYITKNVNLDNQSKNSFTSKPVYSKSDYSNHISSIIKGNFVNNTSLNNQKSTTDNACNILHTKEKEIIEQRDMIINKDSKISYSKKFKQSLYVKIIGNTTPSNKRDITPTSSHTKYHNDLLKDVYPLATDTYFVKNDKLPLNVKKHELHNNLKNFSNLNSEHERNPNLSSDRKQVLDPNKTKLNKNEPYSTYQNYNKAANPKQNKKEVYKLITPEKSYLTNEFNDKDMNELNSSYIINNKIGIPRGYTSKKVKDSTIQSIHYKLGNETNQKEAVKALNSISTDVSNNNNLNFKNKTNYKLKNFMTISKKDANKIDNRDTFGIKSFNENFKLKDIAKKNYKSPTNEIRNMKNVFKNIDVDNRHINNNNQVINSKDIQNKIDKNQLLYDKNSMIQDKNNSERYNLINPKIKLEDEKFKSSKLSRTPGKKINNFKFF